MVQRGKNAETKHVICTVCDNYCPLKANVVGGVLQGLEPYEDPKAICFKAHSWKEHINHPDRILHPMKNVGTRGTQRWVPISWDQALDEIAARLRQIIGTYGPESVAVSSLMGNVSGDQGMIRRFMNLIGSPNFISGLHMCEGNTRRCTVPLSVRRSPRICRQPTASFWWATIPIGGTGRARRRSWIQLWRGAQN